LTLRQFLVIKKLKVDSSNAPNKSLNKKPNQTINHQFNQKPQKTYWQIHPLLMLYGKLSSDLPAKKNLKSMI
jgi:hypothetical protein